MRPVSGWEEARRRFRAPATDRVRLAMRSKLTQTAGCGRLRPNLTAYLVGHVRSAGPGTARATQADHEE